MADQADFGQLSRALDESPVFRFFGQTHRKFAADVVNATFHGEHSNAVDKGVLLRNIARIQAARRDDPELTTEQSEQPPQHWLDLWMKGGWFGSELNEFQETIITLQPAARRFVMIVRDESEVYRDEVSISAPAELEVLTQESASLLTGSVEARVEYLNSRIEALIAERENLLAKGVLEITDDVRRNMAHDLRRLTDEIVRAIASLPREISNRARIYRDWLLNNETGEFISVLERIMDDVLKSHQQGAYKVNEQLLQIHAASGRHDDMVERIKVIVEKCGEFLSADDRIRLRTLFPSVTKIAADILEEEARVADTMLQAARREDLAELQARGQALKEMEVELTRIGATCDVTPRDNRIRDIGLQIIEPTKISVVAGLAGEGPRIKEDPIFAAVTDEDSEAVLEEQRQEAARVRLHARRLKPEVVAKKVSALRAGRNEVSLADMFAHDYPEAGVEEVLAYQFLATQHASSRVPSREALGVDVIVNGLSRHMVIPHIIFTQHGEPGTGLEDWVGIDPDDPQLTTIRSLADGAIKIYRIGS